MTEQVPEIVATPIREQILSLLDDDDVIFFEPPEVFDHAILGLTTSSPGWEIKPRVCYSCQRIVNKLAEEMDYEEALDYFYFNIAGFGLSDPPPPLLIADWDC